MRERTLDAIRASLTATLGQLQGGFQLPEEGHWVYRRGVNNGWQGSLVPKPSFIGLLSSRVLNEAATGVQQALELDYPEYLRAVGTPLGGGSLQSLTIVPRLVYEAHERFGTFAISDEQIEAILADVAAFFDCEEIRLRLYAPALNLAGPVETPPILFPGGFTLRPITDEECTRFYGGNTIFHVRQMPIGFPSFVFVKEITVPKIVGSFQAMSGSTSVALFQEELDRCMLVLASFKDGGAVGYDGIHVTPAQFTLGSAFGELQMYGNEHVPPSRYDLTVEEASQIGTYARLFENIHSTLEMASQRLVDSARRTKPRDAIVDAVIGLEGILLANLGERSELRFRFSLRYASLFPKEDRAEAFYVARDLYDLRSKIAHGGTLDQQVKFNSKSLTLGEAATLARSVLRRTIAVFMPNSKAPNFLNDDYWISRELSLEPPILPPH